MTSYSNGLRTSRFYILVFLTSAIVLLLEIGLTRIFSLLFDYHYTFLSISLALLGLGLGAVFYYKKLARSPKVEKLVSHFSLVAVLPLLVIVILIIWLSNINGLLLMVTFATAPLFYYGIVLSHCFKTLSSKSPQLYATDLLGASIGVLLFLLFIKWGGIAILLTAIAMTAVVAFLLCSRDLRLFRLTNIVAFIVALVLLGAIAAKIWNPDIALLPNYHKEMFHFMKHPGLKAEVKATRWSAFGRTDLIQMDNRPDELVFFIDGSAGSSMYRFNGNWSDTITNEAVGQLKYFPSYLPLAITRPEKKKSALIIGPGGGRDIHVLRLAGVENIQAVEVNGDLLHVAKLYGQFNGGIFANDSNVSVVEDEGRSYLRRSTSKYDIIYLSIPIIKSSRSPESFALSENFLFTVESFNEYLEHLTEDGQLIIVAHDEPEIIKLILTAVQSLRQSGISDTLAYQYFYTAGQRMNPFLSVWKRPIRPEEAKLIHAAIMYTGSFEPNSAYIPHTPQHEIPVLGKQTSVLEEPMFSQMLYDLSIGKYDAKQVVSAVDFNLKPPVDDSPFFYNGSKNAPTEIRAVIIIASILFLILTVPGTINCVRKNDWNTVTLGTIFTCLGIGFMILEVALIQRFILFLGKPVYSLTVLLLTILSSGALGSFVSGLVRASDRTKLKFSLIAIVFLTTIQIFWGPSLFSKYLGDVEFSRILITVIWLLPLGFFLGFPFPLAIRIAGEIGLKDEIPNYWGINGISSVIGSALAVAFAITAGFNTALIVGGAVYLLAAFVSLFLSRGLVVPK